MSYVGLVIPCKYKEEHSAVSSETWCRRKYYRRRVCHSGVPESHCLRLGNMPLGSTVTAPYIVMYCCKCLNAFASKLAELRCNVIPYKL